MASWWLSVIAQVPAQCLRTVSSDLRGVGWVGQDPFVGGYMALSGLGGHDWYMAQYRPCRSPCVPL